MAKYFRSIENLKSFDVWAAMSQSSNSPVVITHIRLECVIQHLQEIHQYRKIFGRSGFKVLRDPLRL